MIQYLKNDTAKVIVRTELRSRLKLSLIKPSQTRDLTSDQTNPD